MQLPKPKSLPGLLLYGLTFVCVVLFLRISWVVVGQNIETVSADKGYDKLLSKHWAEIMAWLGENGFWLSLTFSFFLGATIALWVNLILQSLLSDATKLEVETLSQVDVTTNGAQNPEIEAANSRIETLESQLESIRQKSERQKAIKDRLGEIDTMETLMKAQIPQCWEKAKSLETKFSEIMQKMEECSRSEMLSAREGPLRALKYDLADWDTMLTNVLGTGSIGRYSYDFLKDFSAHTKEPFIPAYDEPPGLSQEMQGRYRKFAAQRDNLRLVEQDAPAILAEEKRSLLSQLDT